MISNVFVTSLRMCLKSNLYVWMWPMAILNFSWSMWYVFYYCSFRKIREIALKERNNHFFHCRKKYAKLFPLIRYSLVMSSPETWLRLWSLLELILLRFVFSFIFYAKILFPSFFIIFKRLESVRDLFVPPERRLELDIHSYLLFWNVRTMPMDYQLILFR